MRKLLGRPCLILLAYLFAQTSMKLCSVNSYVFYLFVHNLTIFVNNFSLNLIVLKYCSDLKYNNEIRALDHKNFIYDCFFYLIY